MYFGRRLRGIGINILSVFGGFRVLAMWVSTDHLQYLVVVGPLKMSWHLKSNFAGCWAWLFCPAPPSAVYPELTGLPGCNWGGIVPPPAGCRLGKDERVGPWASSSSGYKNLKVLRDAVQLGINPMRPSPGWTPRVLIDLGMSCKTLHPSPHAPRCGVWGFSPSDQVGRSKWSADL